MSKKHKKEKKAMKTMARFTFPQEVMVRMDYNPEWDQAPTFDTTEHDFLNDGDRVATYKLISTGKVKKSTTVTVEVESTVAS